MNEERIDSLKVIIPSGATLAVVSLTQLEALLKIGLLAVTIGYTVWKWKNDTKKGKK